MKSTVNNSPGKFAPQQRLRFILYFSSTLGLLAFSFVQWTPTMNLGFMYPISFVTTLLLKCLTISAKLDASTLSQGFCLVQLDGITLRIIHECTGIFTLFIFVAAVLAYPTSPTYKLQGLTLGIPIFFAYSVLRLCVLGLIAHLVPHLIQLFHVYLMVLFNLGFVTALLQYWMANATARE